MKQQTFIAKIETPDGRMVDFYRFGAKDPRRIMRTMKEAAGRDLWRKSWSSDGGTVCKLYATPDEYTEQRPAVWSFDLASVPALGY